MVTLHLELYNREIISKLMFSKYDEVCWFCKKNRHEDCMKKIPIDSRSKGPHDCTFDMTVITCKCKH